MHKSREEPSSWPLCGVGPSADEEAQPKQKQQGTVTFKLDNGTKLILGERTSLATLVKTLVKVKLGPDLQPHPERRQL